MNCTQCGNRLNPVDVLLGPVCGKCARLNHQRICRHEMFRVCGDLGVEDAEGEPGRRPADAGIPPQEGGDVCGCDLRPVR